MQSNLWQAAYSKYDQVLVVLNPDITAVWFVRVKKYCQYENIIWHYFICSSESLLHVQDIFLSLLSVHLVDTQEA